MEREPRQIGTALTERERGFIVDRDAPAQIQNFQLCRGRARDRDEPPRPGARDAAKAEASAALGECVRAIAEREVMPALVKSASTPARRARGTWGGAAWYQPTAADIGRILGALLTLGNVSFAEGDSEKDGSAGRARVVERAAGPEAGVAAQEAKVSV